MDFQFLLAIVGVVLGFVLPATLAIIVYFQLPPKIKCNFIGKHALITGGSKGIGKATAIELLKRGCRCVTIVARNVDSLAKATEDLAAYCTEEQFVQYFPLDVSSGYDMIESVIRTAEESARNVMMSSETNESLGGVDILINNAGTVAQGGFDELNIDSFESQMKANYFSAIYATRAVIGRMKERRSGHVAFVSSAAGQCAIWGYTAYSPSKFAVRAFADVMHMELLPYNIGVTVLYPPNTNTEGFHEELKTMPPEVREISHSAGVFSALDVAQVLVDRLANGDYTASVGMDGWMLSVLTAGAAPEPNVLAAISQIVLGGILRGVMLIYIGTFNAIVQRCHILRHQKTN